MKVLVADKFEKVGLEGLKALGVEVLSDPSLKEQALEDKIREYQPEILVVRSTKVTAPMVTGTSLKLVIRAGAGVNTIDVEAAAQNGVAVANCPGKNAIAVAELAFGLMLAIDRHIPECVGELRRGRWNKAAYSKAKGVYGRTLGLIGLGNIAQEMVPRAQAFGMHVIAYSRWLSPDVAGALGIGRCESVDEVAERSDFVSVHVSLNPGTRGMIGKSFFEAMKPGAVFINTSRAEVVDTQALLEALDAKPIYAGLDVFEDEPSSPEGEYDGPMKDHPHVYCTHHIGASTEQAQEAVAIETVRIVEAFVKTGAVLNEVHTAKAGQTVAVLAVRHDGKALGAVQQALAELGYTPGESEHVKIPYGLISKIGLDRVPDAAHLRLLRRVEGVFDANLC
ncbi:MAG: 3-phosphoglycerate dehydrogenase [Fimbriimonadales bacterium]|nr:3-phosphoglycerate dehydrogenase [Fimbriimonadales bacterium]